MPPARPVFTWETASANRPRSPCKLAAKGFVSRAMVNADGGHVADYRIGWRRYADCEFRTMALLGAKSTGPTETKNRPSVFPSSLPLIAAMESELFAAAPDRRKPDQPSAEQRQ